MTGNDQPGHPPREPPDHRTHGRNLPAIRTGLELHDPVVCQLQPDGVLPSVVTDSLEDDRAPEHPRKQHRHHLRTGQALDIQAICPPGGLQEHPKRHKQPDWQGQSPGNAVHRKWPRITVSPRIVARGRSAYHRHKMATRLKFLGNARNVRRWPADIRRKQVTDDHNPHETPFSSTIWYPSRPSGPRASPPAPSPLKSYREGPSEAYFHQGRWGHRPVRGHPCPPTLPQRRTGSRLDPRFSSRTASPSARSSNQSP